MQKLSFIKKTISYSLITGVILCGNPTPEAFAAVLVRSQRNPQMGGVGQKQWIEDEALNARRIQRKNDLMQLEAEAARRGDPAVQEQADGLVLPAGGPAVSPEEMALQSFSAYLTAFINNANSVTGLMPSNIGGSGAINNPNGTFTYDMALLAMADFGSNSTKILNTYALNNSNGTSPNSPATTNIDYNPGNGVYNNVRILNYVPNWYNTWDFGIHAGPSAWIGMAALQNHERTSSAASLNYAHQRASFLLGMQDPADGGLRMGPNGQFHPAGNDFYWKTKSTENNESALYFLDMLIPLTTNVALKAQYTTAANRIYDWLKSMYDINEHAFSRGAVFNTASGQWVKDGHSLFASDTAHWAPMERILNDTGSIFGTTRADRLSEVERMMDRVKNASVTGVYQTGVLKGISYSPSSRTSGVISIEWSSQYALRRLEISREWERMGDSQKAADNLNQYNQMITSLSGYFTNNAAPYAVYANGTIAGNVATGHGWNTPTAPTNLASATYFAFARAGYNPLTYGGRASSKMMGDINNDGRVSLLDVVSLQKSWGLTRLQAGYNANSDLNQDGVVDAADFAILAHNYGRR